LQIEQLTQLLSNFAVADFRSVLEDFSSSQVNVTEQRKLCKKFFWHQLDHQLISNWQPWRPTIRVHPEEICLQLEK